MTQFPIAQLKHIFLYTCLIPEIPSAIKCPSHSSPSNAQYRHTHESSIERLLDRSCSLYVLRTPLSEVDPSGPWTEARVDSAISSKFVNRHSTLPPLAQSAATFFFRYILSLKLVQLVLPPPALRLQQTPPTLERLQRGPSQGGVLAPHSGVFNLRVDAPPQQLRKRYNRAHFTFSLL